MKRLTTLAIVALLSGCVVPERTITVTGQDSDQAADRAQRITQMQSSAAPASTHSTSTHATSTHANSTVQRPLLTVNDYVRNLVHELMALQHNLDSDSQVGVTDFSYIDSALDQGTVFSNHLSEAMIYDLHKFGVPVLDYKVTDYIRVTESG
ncbi:FlgO family outer membrane protein, partial [Arsukibacterium sp.]|uniref:FlgO family outer membrane protein n=1 Tax=Arsukibacterium sp. TaxID=1977258 RepID=UPI003567A5E8